MTRVGIIDYGVGNLRSIANAFRHVGADPVVSECASTLRQCDRLVFPGVGAFGYGKQALCSRGLDIVVHDAIDTEKPLLAICVGMQLLFEKSFEFGSNAGLGIFDGEVGSFEADAYWDKQTRLPNVNWLPLELSGRQNEFASYLMSDVTPQSRFYFIHSYHASANGSEVTATATYGGQKFAAVASRNNIFATQFHPEKSGPDGLRMLENFADQEGWS